MDSFEARQSRLIVLFHHCLVHQNVSGVTSMFGTFSYTSFDGAIDQWDVSSVLTLDYAFEQSSFNGDVSNWVSGF